MVRRLLSVALLAAVGACADTPTAPQDLDLQAGVVDRDAKDGLGLGMGKKAQVFVVHGINGEDLGLDDEALPVDISLNGACAIQDFRFRTISDGILLDAGTYDIQVHLGGGSDCTGAVAIDVPGAELAPRANVTIVAHLADSEVAGGPTPTATIFDNPLGRRAWQARVVARHVADFGAVDLTVDGGVAFAGVTNGQQGAASLAPGVYTFGIEPAGSGDAALEATLPLDGFRYYALYAVGTPANGTFEVLVQDVSRREARIMPPVAHKDRVDDGEDEDEGEDG